MAEGNSDGSGHWHLDRRVSVGHLLTTAVVGASAVLWLSNVESRVSLNARAIDANTQRIDRIEARQSAALAELKLEFRNGFTAMRTDLRTLGERIDRQRDRMPTAHP